MKEFRIRGKRLKLKVSNAVLISLVLSSLLFPTGNISAREIDPELKLLPENNRYFQYKGLPLIAFATWGDSNTSIPGMANTRPSDIEDIAEYANHFYMGEAKSTRVSFEGLQNNLNNDSDYNQLESIVRTAYENDVMMSILFWSYSWNFSTQTFGDGNNNNTSWKSSDMVRSINDSFLTEDLSKYTGTGPYGPYGLPGVTRMDLHHQSIEPVIRSTWDYPNVTYSFMWEYNWRAYVEDGNYLGETPGSFHRWWVDYFKTQGNSYNPNVAHLFSLSFGGQHPQERNADFIVNESKNAFRWRGGSGVSSEYDVNGVGIPLVQSYGIPMVSWSTDDLRTNHGTISNHSSPTPDQIRDLLIEGHHPAAAFRGLSTETKNYFLQARWYVENILTWGDEPGYRGGDEMNSSNLPGHASSSRPTLANPAGYTLGAKKSGDRVDFAVLYQGSSPAVHVVPSAYNGRRQTEVWVDRNGDGRFDPNPALSSDRLERFLMATQDGVLYTIDGVTVRYASTQDLHYIFRFANRDWYPPETGSLNPGLYSHLTLANFPGGGSTPTPGGSTLTPTAPPSVSILEILGNWLTSTLDQNGDGKVNGVDFGVVLR